MSTRNDPAIGAHERHANAIPGRELETTASTSEQADDVRETLPLTVDRILLTRLECLQSAITRRDWRDTEFHFDRVLSQALKASGERRRHYDAKHSRKEPAR